MDNRWDTERLRSEPRRGSSAADLYVRSCKTFEDHNYSLCLVMAWAIIEKLLQRRWQDYIDSNRERQIDGVKVPFVNVERKDKLTQSRDFGASVISEVLSLVGSLPFKLYQELETTRKARNYWLHGLRPISWQESVGAIGVAQEMLTLVCGINLYVSLVRHWHA